METSGLFRGQVLGHFLDRWFSSFRVPTPLRHSRGRYRPVAATGIGGVPTAAHMSTDVTSHATNPSRTVTADVLGARFTFAIDPDRLNEAGVVWDVAVRACAEAMAPMIRSALSAPSARREGGDGDATARVNVLELGAGTGALGIALASIERTRVFVTDLEPVVGLASSNAKRNARLVHATSRVEAGALPWSLEPGNVPDPERVFVTRRHHASSSRNDANDGERTASENKRDDEKCWHFVAACETLYWGGWDVFADDTRAPQLATMVEACGGGHHAETGRGNRDERTTNEKETENERRFACVLVVAFTVRDVTRETEFVLRDVGDAFWLSRCDDDDASFAAPNCSDADEASARARADARARAYVAGANEGDLLVFRGRIKERRRAT